MDRWRAPVFAWLHALCVSALPLFLVYLPHWAPVPVLAILAFHSRALSIRRAEPARSLLIFFSALLACLLVRGWAMAGLVLLGAILVAGFGWISEAWPHGRRPDAADFLMATLITLDLFLFPETFNSSTWILSAVAALSARRALRIALESGKSGRCLRPPTKDVRGTLSFSGVIMDDDELPRSSELDFELRAGTSLALLFDNSAEAALLLEYLCGRRSSARSTLSIDGETPDKRDSLIAVICAGESFIPGDLQANLEAFVAVNLSPGARAGVWEAFSLAEVEEELGNALIRRDGEPLEAYHRFLLQAARVIPSSYRVIVALDPMPWINPVRGGIWRAALLRACLGRTSIVLTADRELAGCMDRVLLYRHGNLRETELNLGE